MQSLKSDHQTPTIAWWLHTTCMIFYDYVYMYEWKMLWISGCYSASAVLLRKQPIGSKGSVDIFHVSGFRWRDKGPLKLQSHRYKPVSSSGTSRIVVTRFLWYLTFLRAVIPVLQWYFLRDTLTMGLSSSVPLNPWKIITFPNKK